MKKILTLITTIILIFAISIPALAADGNVIYSGNAGEFIFQPGSDYSLTDLFPDFKDVMPGDTLTQKILVKNNAKKRVRIYVRSLGAQEESVDFLKQMSLYVGVKENTALFEAPADQSAQLTEWTQLGTFEPGAEIELEVGLQVPTTMDNKDKKHVGYIDWEFLVEEIGGPRPQTGDNANYLPWAITAGASLVVIVCVFWKRRKKDKDDVE